MKGKIIAGHGSKAVKASGHLTKSDQSILAEALRRGETTRAAMENALVEYGRWILVNVFDDDAAAALDKKRDNAVWHELLHRAGGPTLHLSERLLRVAVDIAAHDKRIQDDTWRLLDPGRKELLLPLKSEDSLREAAQRVVTMKMSQRATRRMVQEELEARGSDARTRLTRERFRAQVAKFNERVKGRAFQARVESLARASTPEQRAAIRGDLEALAAWVKGALATFKKKA